MNKNGGQMRFSDAELGLINNTFADNEKLLKTLRKVFYQVDLTDEDKAIIKIVQSPEVLKILRKIFLPEIDVNAPLGQNVDLFMTINVQGKEPIDVSYELDGRVRVIKALENGLNRLVSFDNNGINNIVKFEPLLYRANADEDMISVTARNTVIMHVEQQLLQIRALAGIKKETLEETKRRLEKDSTK